MGIRSGSVRRLCEGFFSKSTDFGQIKMANNERGYPVASYKGIG